MGEVRSADWYSLAYRPDPNLTADVATSTFGTLWREMARRVPDDARIVEVGCGAGQLAAMIAPRSTRYFGFDFSPEAVAAAHVRVARACLPTPLGARGCQVMTVEESIEYATASPRHWRHALLVACEVLERLAGDQDLAVLSAHAGADVLLSLPTKDSAGHVRWFPTAASVRERYERHVGEMTVEPFEQWWIVEGTAR